MREDIVPIAPGEKLTREEFAQRYWSSSHPIQPHQYVWMDIDAGRDEIEQLILNNIRALHNELYADVEFLLELIYKKCSTEQPPESRKDFHGRDAAKKPADDQPTKKVQRCKAPVDATFPELHPLLFTLLGLLTGYILGALFKILKGV